MPNRIIKESARTSTTLDALSDGAERMFWRLTTVADDYGRFDANPKILLATCFPLRVTSLKIRQILKWYHELEACKLVQSYDCNGKHLGFFSTWEKHQQVRAKASKFPAPSSDSICNHLQSNVSVSESEIRDTRSENGPPQSIGSAFSQFWKLYPNRVGKGAAEKAWQKLKPNVDLSDRIISAIKAQIRWRAGRVGQFTPEWKNPATWLNQRCWEDEVPKNTGPQPQSTGALDELKKAEKEYRPMTPQEKDDVERMIKSIGN